MYNLSISFLWQGTLVLIIICHVPFVNEHAADNDKTLAMRENTVILLLLGQLSSSFGEGDFIGFYQ